MKIAALVAALLMLFLSGATYTQPHRALVINEEFLFANNDDIIDAVPAYAEAICIQDKATERTQEAWLIAGAKCADSYRDDQADVSSGDGGWIEYRAQAFNEVKALCARRGNVDDLCD